MTRSPYNGRDLPWAHTAAQRTIVQAMKAMGYWVAWARWERRDEDTVMNKGRWTVAYIPWGTQAAYNREPTGAEFAAILLNEPLDIPPRPRIEHVWGRNLREVMLEIETLDRREPMEVTE